MTQKLLYQFEIEAEGKPLFDIGEWEELSNLTDSTTDLVDLEVAAYGEVEVGKYKPLFFK